MVVAIAIVRERAKIDVQLGATGPASTKGLVEELHLAGPAELDKLRQGPDLTWELVPPSRGQG